MHIVFDTHEAVGLAFRSAIGTAGLFALLVAVALWAAGHQNGAFGWRFSLGASALFFVGCVAVVRHTRDCRFFEMDGGHQAPAGNQTVDPELKDQTFYMSNMAPQRPSLNRGIWEVLEGKTRAWVFRYGHAYEWTGPIRCDPELPRPPDAKVDCQRQTIGEDAVAVPYDLKSFIVSIERIETLTGIEFMPKMSASDRRKLISEASTMWP